MTIPATTTSTEGLPELPVVKGNPLAYTNRQKYTADDMRAYARAALAAAGAGQQGEAVRERDEARARVADLEKSHEAAQRAGLEFRSRLLEAQREGAEAKKDAARYLWLRDEAVNFGGDEPSVWCVIGTGYEDQMVCDGDQLEKSIDAARSTQEEPRNV